MKIIFDPKNEESVKNLYSVKNKKDAYKVLEERQIDKVRYECKQCPCCGVPEYTVDDFDGSKHRYINVVRNVSKYEIIQKFLKHKIPVVFNYRYTCKNCGAIYESEEVNMEEHVLLLK